MTAAGFRTRRVSSDSSLGDLLKKARNRKKLTVAEVEEATRIRAKFLLALESDSWDQIPSEVYGRGYLESYASFLGLPVEKLLSQFERSRATYCRNLEPVDLAPVTRKNASRFVVTPRTFIIAGTMVVSVLFVAFVFGQLTRFSAAPYLSLVTPAEAKSIGTSQLEISGNSYNLKGKTTSGATVHVNGVTVAVETDGSFSQTVPIQSGVNAIEVEAVSPSGTTSRETVTVTVR